MNKPGSVLLALLLLSACAAQRSVEIPESVPEIRPGLLQGYLAADALPNSAALIPPVPADGSATARRDLEMSAATLPLRGSPRWDLAAADAVLHFPEAAETYSCALGLPVTATATPNLYMLLRRTLTDAGLATYSAKNLYQRQRPFLVNGEPICSPDEQAMLSTDGSYPSGHSALGWAWALILAELAPDRADLLFARGRAFSESRLICNVHWLSDIEEGRFVGSTAVARLHADPVFRAQLELAGAELDALRAAGAQPTRDCAAEAAALVP